MDLRLRPATAGDLARVEALLTDAGLITAGVQEHIDHFLLAEEDGRIVASAGLERYGTEALLRSVAVAPEYRNHGLAQTLVARLLAQAAAEQIREVYLFTTTAVGYFRHFGFEPVGRDDVVKAVRASKEYGECCSTAQPMRLVVR
jgi:amino-acid N-acetyltransferase